jgi:hypothetical protein
MLQPKGQQASRNVRYLSTTHHEWRTTVGLTMEYWHGAFRDHVIEVVYNNWNKTFALRINEPQGRGTLDSEIYLRDTARRSRRTGAQSPEGEVTLRWRSRTGARAKRNGSAGEAEVRPELELAPVRSDAPPKLQAWHSIRL